MMDIDIECRPRAPTLLAPHRVLQVGSGVTQAAAPVVWLEPGAAFETHALVPGPDGGACARLDDLAGAAALHSLEADETLVLDLLRRRHGALASGRVLCAAGVVDLYRAVCQLRGTQPRRYGMAQIAAAAVGATSADCARTMTIFCGLLGDAAGRTALTLGARGGVFIGGAIVPLLGDWFVRSAFRRRFEACAHAPQVLRAIPTFVVQGAARTTSPGSARPMH
jgi:glucokinase